MLKIEVIRFEAEDVITASVETPVEKPEEKPVEKPEEKPAECICSDATYVDHHPVLLDANGEPMVGEDGLYVYGTNHSLAPACPASEHPNCVYQQVN